MQLAEVSVAHALLEILEGQGVKYIFGVPGGPLTGLFEALHERNSIAFVLAKHEGGAAFMAAAHARVSGGLAVCCVTSGPGGTNALTGIASAYTESLPVLLLTGQVATHVFGTGAIQESSVHGIDLVSLYRPVTKFSAMLPHVDRSPDIIRSAIRAALSGRRGPVHLSLPADIITRPVRHLAIPPRKYGGSRSTAIDNEALARAAQLLNDAEHPCFLAGHGVALANASGALVELARALRAPVATTPKGKGVFPENDPLALGVLGFGGHERTQAYIESEEVDVLVVVGSSMNEFVTNAWTVGVHACKKLVQIDIDPTSIAKNYPVDVAVVGDARAALHELVRHLPARTRTNLRHSSAPPVELQCLPRQLVTASPSASAVRPLKPQHLVHELRAAMPDDAMLFVDAGSCILWSTHYFEVRRPNTYFIDLGLSAMGSAVAGVVGGALAAPTLRAVALVGDAAFAMHGFEVHTAVEQRLPVVWVVLNNSGHGMVRQGDMLMKGKDLGVSMFRVPLDIAGMARAVGARGVRVETATEFRRAIDEALTSDQPTVIDALIDPSEVAPTLERRVQTLARFFASRGALGQ